jgi:hypothetical protein
VRVNDAPGVIQWPLAGRAEVRERFAEKPGVRNSTAAPWQSSFAAGELAADEDWRKCAWQ